jgi:hypothetical protein
MRMMYLLIAIISCSAVAHGAETEESKKPARLLELRARYAEERAKVMIPLMEHYIAALKREQRAETKKGELETALAYLEEVRMVRDWIVEETSTTEGAANESDNAKPSIVKGKEKKPKGGEPSIVKVGTASHKSFDGSDALDVKYTNLCLHCIADGVTKGVITMKLPSGKRVEVYKWTGDEGEFIRRSPIIKDPEKEIAVKKIDISKHTTEAGKYNFYFEAKEGEGTLSIYQSWTEWED